MYCVIIYKYSVHVFPYKTSATISKKSVIFGWKNIYIYKYHNILRRCLWCNGNRRTKRTRRHEFKSWPRLIAFHIALIPLEKVGIQLFSLQLGVNSRTDCFFSLGEATSLGEGILWIQTCQTQLKNWPCVISCPSGGVGKYDKYDYILVAFYLRWLNWSPQTRFVVISLVIVSCFRVFSSRVRQNYSFEYFQESNFYLRVCLCMYEYVDLNYITYIWVSL